MIIDAHDVLIKCVTSYQCVISMLVQRKYFCGPNGEISYEHFH